MEISFFLREIKAFCVRKKNKQINRINKIRKIEKLEKIKEKQIQKI